MRSHVSAWLALTLSLGACGEGSSADDDGLVTDGGEPLVGDDSGGRDGTGAGPQTAFPLFLDQHGSGGKEAGKVHGHFVGGTSCPKRTSSPETASVRCQLTTPGEAERSGATGVLYTTTNKPSEPLGFIDLVIERQSGSVRCHLPYVGDMAFPFDGDDPACLPDAGTQLEEPVTSLAFSIDPEAYYSSPCVVNLRFVDDSYMESSQE